MVVNIYSTNPGYYAINNACRKNYLRDVLYTLTAVYQEIRNNKNLMIMPGTKLYRGVSRGCEGNQTGFWPAFTSLTTNFDVALNFGKRLSFKNKFFIFELTLDSNNPFPHAMIQAFSEYQGEEEVLLLPLFPAIEVGR